MKVTRQKVHYFKVIRQKVHYFKVIRQKVHYFKVRRVIQQKVKTFLFKFGIIKCDLSIGYKELHVWTILNMHGISYNIQKALP